MILAINTNITYFNNLFKKMEIIVSQEICYYSNFFYIMFF
jgi:hypothetical protein